MSAPTPSGPLSAPSLSPRQREAISSLQGALSEGASLALLIGAEGSGKTMCLRSMQAQGLGKYLDRIDGAAIGTGALLLDGTERLSAEAFEEARAELGERRLIEVLAAIGYYISLGCILIATDMELPKGAQRLPRQERVV